MKHARHTSTKQRRKAAVGFRKMTPTERRMFDDIDWGRTAPEVQQYRGELVAIRNTRVLGHGLDRKALIKAAAADDGCSPQEIVVIVVPPAGIVETPH
jgi:hypothetical protein